jgi:hypothetical protein
VDGPAPVTTAGCIGVLGLGEPRDPEDQNDFGQFVGLTGVIQPLTLDVGRGHIGGFLWLHRKNRSVDNRNLVDVQRQPSDTGNQIGVLR